MNKITRGIALPTCLVLTSLASAASGTTVTGQAAASQLAPCAPAAYVILEAGKIAGVDWVEHLGNRVHSRVVLTQSRVMDATIDLRPDQTASHSSVILTVAGEPPEKPKTRDLGEGAIYWSDMIPSSIEQALARAHVLGQDVVRVRTANLYRDSPGELEVRRLDATNWVVRANNKRYDVLTDDHGCMLSATLPEYGVLIERRTDISAEQYPLWGPHEAPPDGAYRATEVSIPAPQGHTLAGTLTTPLNVKVVPAAVLITGLAPHERNNGQPPWMPFRDVADALTRADIAVLRVDDRGVGKSTGDHAPSTSFDEVDDVQTEVAWLRKQPGIDPKRIALVGYSEGGFIAPMVAAKDPAIAAIVTLDGPGVPISEVARYQVEQTVLHDQKIATADRQTETEKRLAEALKDLTARERVAMTINPIDYDQQVRCPALIIHGGTDMDVPPRSAEKIAMAMRGNGNRDVTVRIFPGVSHSLLPDAVGLSSGWPMLPGFLTSPDLLDYVSKWSAEKLGVQHK